MLFVQNLLRNERGNLSCEPYIQTQSRRVSRMEDSIGVKFTKKKPDNDIISIL